MNAVLLISPSAASWSGMSISPANTSLLLRCWVVW